MFGKKNENGNGKVMAGRFVVHCAHDELVQRTNLKAHPGNVNEHSKDQIKMLAKFIMARGWRAPITISTRSNFVVRGHCRLYAAEVLECSVVPVDYQDYADEAEEIADLIADNRIQELSEFNRPKLKDALIDLDTGAFDMDLTGYDKEALEKMMTATGPPASVKITAEVTCPKCEHKFVPGKKGKKQ